MSNPIVATAVMLGWTVLACAPIVAVVGWWLNRPRRPSVRFVGPAIDLPPASDDLTRLLPVRFVGRASVTSPKGPPKGWAELAEFAGASHRTAATIWAELDGVFTAKGMRTA